MLIKNTTFCLYTMFLLSIKDIYIATFKFLIYLVIPAECLDLKEVMIPYKLEAKESILSILSN